MELRNIRCINWDGYLPIYCVTFFINIFLDLKCQITWISIGGGIIRTPYKITIGENTVIGDNCKLDGRGNLKIGKNCNISSDVKIWTAQHDSKSPLFDYVKEPVIIGDYCWISSDVIILPGVTIGDGCVIAAGAVVSKNCEPYGFYAGVPAKRVKERTKDLRYSFDGNHDWFI